jgi:hypothetical protein
LWRESTVYVPAQDMKARTKQRGNSTQRDWSGVPSGGMMVWFELRLASWSRGRVLTLYCQSCADAFNVSCNHAATSTGSSFKCRLRSPRRESRNTLRLGDTDSTQIDHHNEQAKYSRSLRPRHAHVLFRPCPENSHSLLLHIIATIQHIRYFLGFLIQHGQPHPSATSPCVDTHTRGGPDADQRGYQEGSRGPRSGCRASCLRV